MVGDLVNGAPVISVLRGVFARQKENLPRALLPDLPREKSGATTTVEGTHIRVGLHKARVLARCDRQIGDDVERVAPARSLTVDDGNNDLRAGANQALYLENMQPLGARGVDALGRFCICFFGVAVHVATSD